MALCGDLSQNGIDTKFLTSIKTLLEDPRANMVISRAQPSATPTTSASPATVKAPVASNLVEKLNHMQCVFPMLGPEFLAACLSEHKNDADAASKKWSGFELNLSADSCLGSQCYIFGYAATETAYHDAQDHVCRARAQCFL